MEEINEGNVPSVTLIKLLQNPLFVKHRNITLNLISQAGSPGSTLASMD